MQVGRDSYNVKLDKEAVAKKKKHVFTDEEVDRELAAKDQAFMTDASYLAYKGLSNGGKDLPSLHRLRQRRKIINGAIKLHKVPLVRAFLPDIL